MASAKRVLTDNGLKIVCGAVGVTGLWEPNPKFAENLAVFKKRCEQFAELGAPLVYSPCATSAKFTPDDYARCPEQIRQVAEVARQFKLKVAAEFVRNSTFLASLPTALRLHREAAHPELRHPLRLLSLLVRTQQIRGYGPDPAWRDHPCPFERHAGLAARIAGSAVARGSRRWRGAAGERSCASSWTGATAGPISVELFLPNSSRPIRTNSPKRSS